MGFLKSFLKGDIWSSGNYEIIGGIDNRSGAFSVSRGSGQSIDRGSNINCVKRLTFTGSDGWSGYTSSSGSHSHSVSLNNTGGGVAHNNMQPYLSVYMWKRVK